MSQSSSDPTLYDILEVKPTADPEEIRRAYKKKALETHPDKVLRTAKGPVCKAEIEARFCQVKEAFEILNDSQKRRAYDIRLAYRKLNIRRAQTAPVPPTQQTQQAHATYTPVSREEAMKRMQAENERRARERAAWEMQERERHRQRMNSMKTSPPATPTVPGGPRGPRPTKTSRASHPSRPAAKPTKPKVYDEPEEFEDLVDMYLEKMLLEERKTKSAATFSTHSGPRTSRTYAWAASGQPL